MTDTEVNATNGAKEKAKELGVDLENVTGSLEGGRIQQSDVEEYHQAIGPAEPAEGAGETDPPSGEAKADVETLDDEGVEEDEEVDLGALRELVPHLDNSGLQMIRDKADSDDDLSNEQKASIIDLVDAELRHRPESEDEVVQRLREFVDMVANIQKAPQSRSQLRRQAQAVLRDLEHLEGRH